MLRALFVALKGFEKWLRFALPYAKDRLGLGDVTMAILDERKAYEAMFAFLRNRWERMKSDELGSLLGEMSIVPEESSDWLETPRGRALRTGDPATWWDWMAAVEEVEKGTPADLYMRLTK